VESGERGDHRVRQPLLDVLAVDPHHRIGHQVADVADEHQGTALEAQPVAARRLIDAIRLQPPLQPAAAFVEASAQLALHQPSQFR
jgi:hypothetical protein